MGAPYFLADASGYEINKVTRPRLPDSKEPDANAWRLISAIEFLDILNSWPRWMARMTEQGPLLTRNQA